MFYGYDSDVLITEFQREANERFSDPEVRVKVLGNDNRKIGVASLSPSLERQKDFRVNLGVENFDKDSPEDAFRLAQSFYKEMWHVEHMLPFYDDREAFSDRNSRVSIAMLAAKAAPSRYKDGSGHNILNALSYRDSLYDALNFCRGIYNEDDVDWDEVTVKSWNKYLSSPLGTFDIFAYGDIRDAHKASDLYECFDAMVDRCQSGYYNWISDSIAPDLVHDYLYGETGAASYEFLRAWEGADNEYKRDFLAAAILVETEPAYVEKVFPGAKYMGMVMSPQSTRMFGFDPVENVFDNPMHLPSDYFTKNVVKDNEIDTDKGLYSKEILVNVNNNELDDLDDLVGDMKVLLGDFLDDYETMYNKLGDKMSKKDIDKFLSESFSDVFSEYSKEMFDFT